MFKTLLFFCLLPVFCQAQYDNRDSLLKIIQQIRQSEIDTAHIRKLSHLGYDITETDSLLSKQLLDESLAKAIGIKQPNSTANCHRLLGIWFSNFGMADSALLHYRLSLAAARQKNSLYLMAGAWFNMGNIKYDNGEYDSCIHFFQLSQKVFEDPKILDAKEVKANMIDKRKADLYRNLSNVFSTIGDIKKAGEYIDKAINISQKYTSPAAALGTAYFMQSKASNYYDNGLVEKALRTRIQYLPFMESKINLKSTLADSYNSIAHEYVELAKPDSALIYAKKSMQIANDIKQPSAVANANFGLAEIFFHKKDYQQATAYMQQAKEYVEQFENPHDKIRYNGLMHQLAKANGDYREAYEYLAAYQTLNDSLKDGKRARAFREMEMRFETGKKEATIKIQEASIRQKNIINYALIGGAAALLFISLFAYRNHTNKQKLQQQRIAELETEKQLLATQSLLQGQEDERSRLAKDLHDGLGGLLSGVKLQLGAMKGNLILSEEHGRNFNNALNKLDESISEMRRVAHNMMPEALMKLGLQQALQDYCESLSYSQPFTINTEFYGLEQRMEPSVEIVIYRIVQELVNNAVKHSGASTILAQVIRREENITITVEDNGKGFSTDQLSKVQSVGLHNIQSRVNYLRGQIDIQSTPGSGTSVHIDCTI